MGLILWQIYWRSTLFHSCSSWFSGTLTLNFFRCFPGVFPNSRNFWWRRRRPGRICTAAQYYRGKKFMISSFLVLFLLWTSFFLCKFSCVISESKCLIHSHKSLWGGSSRRCLYCLVHFYFRRRRVWSILLEDLYCLVHFYWRLFLVDFAWVQPLSNISCGTVGPILVLLVQVA